MIKGKDKLLEKMYKKNYNNQLEEILEKKEYNEEVKSLLLNILYKIEASYKDYEKVKRNTIKKEEYIEKIFKIIKEDCKEIEFKKIDVKKENNNNQINKTFDVDKSKGKIICYPIERKLLYAIAKIHKNDRIVEFDNEIISSTFSNMINIGNNINVVEVLRDFNGYSWNIISRDIENMYYNLIYQDLILIVGNEILEEWTDNNLEKDYFKIFEKILEQYGTQIKEELKQQLFKISFLLEFIYNKQSNEYLLNEKNICEQDLEKIKNSKEYISNLGEQKKKYEKQIKRIDKILNNKELLEKEYQKTNEKLPLNKKIFSMRVLSEKMKEERQQIIKKIEDINNIMNPQKFLQKKNILEEKEKYFQILESNNLSNELYKTMINIQKIIINSLVEKINQAKTKAEVLNLFYEIRYYNLIPISQEESIGEIENLKNGFLLLEKNIILKAIELKLISEISSSKKLNVLIIKNIFKSKIINLEDICLKVTKQKETLYVQIFDEEFTDEKIQIEQDSEQEKTKIKLNKKIKLFL